MKVLLIGAGGREHALGWKLASSPRVDHLISLPGNPGLAALGGIVEGIDPTNPGAVATVAAQLGVDLVVVGPEAPLAAGVVDALTDRRIPVWGPSRAAARLESSKTFAKEVMDRAGVATAGWRSFNDQDQALGYLARMDGPFVVKADGLAAGKGVLVTGQRTDAEGWVKRCLAGGFGGSTVVIEDFLDGPEVSVFALCSGTEAVGLQPARDYKRLLDGDHGPNTGGMGSYSPVSDLPQGLVDDTLEQVIGPVLAEMAAAGTPYNGFLYAGLVLTAAGPRVLEFNCRLGDPETQVVLPLLESDLIELIEAGLAGKLGEANCAWSDSFAVSVVLASAGYPDDPHWGVPIILPTVDDGQIIFQAGTAFDGKRLMTSGGRVLSAVGLGVDREEARDRAYRLADGIRFGGKQHRDDIAS